MPVLRPIAFHLPQFHPFPENDAWWGKGFTEWSNVTRAKPHFRGHYQPHLPSDLGFYDLRLEEARLAQETLAKQYAIYGFCYYHYWFNGKRLMHEPVDRKLQNPKEDLPFMLCWANENWSRRWDGQDSDLLISQDYSKQDDIAHINFLCTHYFKDPRYIKIKGKPFFVIYRPQLFPNLAETIKIWRQEALKYNFELYLAYTTSFNQTIDIEKYGLDAAIEFAPHFHHPQRYFSSKFNHLVEQLEFKRLRLTKKLLNEKHYPINQKLHDWVKKKIFGFYQKNYVLEYDKMVEYRKNIKLPAQTYPSLFPMWDNTARKNGKNAVVYINNTPQLYKKWLQNICDNYAPTSEEENFVFINAWNEWAEGNHLEPCKKWGHSYLQATLDVMSKYQ